MESEKLITVIVWATIVLVVYEALKSYFPGSPLTPTETQSLIKDNALINRLELGSIGYPASLTGNGTYNDAASSQWTY